MRLSGRPASIAALAATSLLLAGCVGAPATEEPDPSHGYPVEVTSCGHTSTVEERPERAVTVNQGATEVALALGVADQLAGTAYLDDDIPAKWRDEYESVPVLAEQYPTREDLLGAKPDMVYASYPSAFDQRSLGSRDELEQSGIATYLSPLGCEDADHQPEVSFDAVWDEIDQVANAFGVPQRAERIRHDQQAELDELAKKRPGAGMSVFWYDSGTRTPMAGAGDGGPQLILDAVGADNIFGDVDGGWADVSWERVVAADPDVIVLADADWSTARQKLEHLRSDPVLSQLTAVRERRIGTLPFSETTPGVRLADGAVALGEQLENISRDR